LPGERATLRTVTGAVDTCIRMVPAPTPRLRFREWKSDDLPLALQLWGDARVTALIGGPFTQDQVARRLAEEIATESVHGIQYWPVFEGNAFVGCCGLGPRTEGVHELGFHLLPSAWGRGLATEAALAAIDHAFAALGVRALFAGHHPDNGPSRRLLSKLGFRWTHDELYAPTGRMHPCYELTSRR
jgi:[ribosomal protein S5]-alanine N-acetyltransferase